MDSVKRGITENDGRGGVDRVPPPSPERELTVYAATLPKIDVYGDMVKQDVTLMFVAMVETHLAR